MKPYNGHRIWNAWNVSLWINKDEALYYLALDCIERARRGARTRSRIISSAAKYFLDSVGWGSRTPDGAVYNHLCVKLALQGLIEEE